MNRLILCFLTAVVGLYLFIKRFKQHKAIDSENTAVVIKVIDLGKMNNRKAYAIRYQVRSEEPFEFLETPVTKLINVNQTRTIKYQEKNPKNYYFPSKILKLDKRLIPSAFLAILGITSTIASVILLVL